MRRQRQEIKFLANCVTVHFDEDDGFNVNLLLPPSSAATVFASLALDLQLGHHALSWHEAHHERPPGEKKERPALRPPSQRRPAAAHPRPSSR